MLCCQRCSSHSNLPMGATVAQDTLPVTASDMKRVYPPFFKILKGKVANKAVTWMVNKSFEGYYGFYYYDDGKRVQQIENREQAFISVVNFQEPVAYDIHDLETERNVKKRAGFVFSAVLLSPFAGWFKDSSFVGYFVDSSLTQQVTPYNYQGHEVSTLIGIPFDHTVPVRLAEQPSDYHIVANRMMLPYSRGKIKINLSLALPNDTALQQKLLSKCFEVTGETDLFRIITQYIEQKIQENPIFKHSVSKEIGKGYEPGVGLSLTIAYRDEKMISFMYQSEELKKSKGLIYDRVANRFWETSEVFEFGIESSLYSFLKTTPTIQAILIAEQESGGGFESESPSSFFLTGSGIMFQYPPSLGILGFTHVFVSYEDLKPYLSDEFKRIQQHWR